MNIARSRLRETTKEIWPPSFMVAEYVCTSGAVSSSVSAACWPLLGHLCLPALHQGVDHTTQRHCSNHDCSDEDGEEPGTPLLPTQAPAHRPRA